jgi:hypothetical protein
LTSGEVDNETPMQGMDLRTDRGDGWAVASLRRCNREKFFGARREKMAIFFREWDTILNYRQTFGIWYFEGMARLARLVVPGLPHHITQRGKVRRDPMTTRYQRVHSAGLTPFPETPFPDRKDKDISKGPDGWRPNWLRVAGTCCGA